MRRLLPACVVLITVACAQAADRPASNPASRPASGPDVPKQDLPGFGVKIPLPPPGFTPVAELRYGLITGEVAAWRSDRTGERIDLWWRPLVHGFDQRDGIEDYFRDAAMNPILLGHDDKGNPTPEDAKRTETKVPHWASWPTVRFEWKGSKPVGVRRTEAIAANNLVYVMVHWAPNGESPEGKAGFDAIAEQLEFAPPATLGQAIAVGSRRIEVAGGATIRLPEPFRTLQPKSYHANAFDLTIATQRRDDDVNSSDFGADLYFADSGRELPEYWARGEGSPELRRLPKAWQVDEGDIRIAEPVHWGTTVALVGGRRLDGDRWLWVAWLVPKRVVDDAGGETKLRAVLELTLLSARPVDEAK